MVLAGWALCVVTACGAEPAGPSGSQTGSASAPAPAPSTPAAAQRCQVADPGLAGATPVRIAVPDGSLYGIEAGSGPRGVVLVHGTGAQGLCVWRREIPALTAAGYRVLAFDHRCVGASTCAAGGVDLVADIAAAATHLRAGGAGTVTVIGASAGTAQVIVAAATPAVPLSAAVTLSPGRLDTDVRAGVGEPRTARQAGPLVRVPILYIVAGDDRQSSVPSTQALHDATPAAYRTILAAPTGGHAQQLLYPDADPSGSPGGPGYDAVLAFLRRHSSA
jgi:pimeloyl-ACP methyl ester carboxylesterase